ncbi:MAG: enoyl-CoA hydratase/isomerase family protein [Candidatus Obscuribacterales bacterium]|nr:enoyl-CoA hydratase/isomerase family protein [Candidatus Obscuribacterales bacterium]
MSGESSKVLEKERNGSLLMTDTLLLEKEGQIAWIKLNRLKVHNSLNSELLIALKAACKNIAEDREIRVVIVTGAGSKVFCAGADLSERKGMSEGQVLDYLNLIQSCMLALEELPQPVIAAINGSAFGGGTELALSCDLRIMTEDAQLRLTEVKLGIIPGAGGTQRLSRLIGKSRAKEIILTARAVKAAEALNIGLVHKLTAAAPKDAESHEELLKEARLWANEIATAAPLALKAAKFAIDKGFDRDLESGLALETKAYLQLMNTKDRLEGLKAFAEKRDPVYRGE